MVEEWLRDNTFWMIPAGITLFILAVVGFILDGIKNRRTSTSDQADISRILGGFTTEQEMVPVDEGPWSWSRWWQSTQPRYQDASTEVIYTGARHGSPDEKIIEEGVDEYVGKHRLPENLTAQQFNALMSQTREIPVMRTLAPGWREVVPA